MDDLIKKIFSGDGPEPPEPVVRSLNEQFGDDLLNLEWSSNHGLFEALFYFEMKEHLARFLKSGEMLEYRVNLPREDWPGFLTAITGERGEIMNVLEVHTPEQQFFDIIVRDNKLLRSEISMDSEGRIVSERTL